MTDIDQALAEIPLKLLVPCPFCGSADLHQIYTDSEGGWGCIVCFECGGKGGDIRTVQRNEEGWRAEAAAKWNRRAPPPDEAQAIIQDCWGALNFILAFYEPGQRYLDTNAWKQAEASGHRAHAAARAWLDAAQEPTSEPK